VCILSTNTFISNIFSNLKVHLDDKFHPLSWPLQKIGLGYSVVGQRIIIKRNSVDIKKGGPYNLICFLFVVSKKD
jgi:hypothetical protein